MPQFCEEIKAMSKFKKTHKRNRSHVPQYTPIEKSLITDHPVEDIEIQKHLGHSRAVMEKIMVQR